MEEIWKDVVGFEGRYKVNQYGKIYSILARRILKTCISNKGYELVCLKNKNGRRKQYTVHRIVALAFVPNENNYPIINHIDENKLNNCFTNLEWCTYAYNNSYNGVGEKKIKAVSKTVYQYDLNWKLLAVYPSTREAGRQLKCSYGNISNACNCPELIRYGCHWSYEER